MMMSLTISQISWIKQNNGLREGYAEASELGLKPGQWPTVLTIQGKNSTKIFHMTTLPHPEAIKEANEKGHLYRSSDGGFTVFIAND